MYRVEEYFETGENDEGMRVSYSPGEGLIICMSYDMGFASTGEILDRKQVVELRDFLNKVLDKMTDFDAVQGV